MSDAGEPTTDYKIKSRDYRQSNQFRFKDKDITKRTDDKCSSSVEMSTTRKRDRSDHHPRSDDRHRRRRKHKHSSTKARTPENTTSQKKTRSTDTSENYLDPEEAFRESLFDALADDDCAQFWEGVYGQPIHTYPNTKLGPDGELERMSDDEYAAYVRTKMYERTHQYLFEEKARRDEARKRADATRRETSASAKLEREKLYRSGANQKYQDDIFQREIEQSIKRGRERKERKTWSDYWNKYLERWKDLGKGGCEDLSMRSIPWPIESGKYKDANLENIERFFRLAPTAGKSNNIQLDTILKAERIRWHPDKIQHKLGGQDISKDILQAVTSIFQIIDELWSQLRESSS
ncbi:hypothetical protein K3495_g3754 [Podosphaera aphanis]|nr:hypothetical protein K3495_g3754 [Podosphaera aphanis]